MNLRWRGPFGWAVALSLLLHAAAFWPRWQLPALYDLLHPAQPELLSAHLLPPAVKRTVSSKSLAPERHPPATPLLPPSQPVAENTQANSPAVDTAPVQTASGAIPSSSATTGSASSGPGAVTPSDVAPSRPQRALPGSGKVRFSVTRGNQGFVVGRATHEWQIDGDRYTLRSVTETVGLVALFKSVRITQESVGRLDNGGLQPDKFVAERGSDRDQAVFDWAAMRLTLGNGTSTALQLGAQDLLSMFYQFALYSLDAPEIAVMATTGRKYERYVFQVVGEEPLTLNEHTMNTYHLRTRASDGETTEVWLAPDFERLPVKIRYTDRKGDSFELLAEEINYKGNP